MTGDAPDHVERGWADLGRPRPVVLVVLDGFGIGPRAADDAIV